MVGELVPAPIDPISAPKDFWTRYHAFRRDRQKASRPDDPVRGDAEEETSMKRPDPFQFRDRFEVHAGGRMLGLFTGWTVKPESPEYATNKHLYDTDLYVLPEHRRQGIGSSFLPVIVEVMEGHGCTTVGFWVEEESGHAFMRRVQAQPKMSSIESRLKVSEVDWPMLDLWVEEGQARSPQTRLETYDGRIPEAMWADYAPQLSSMLNTIPFEDIDHGDIVITPEQFREWYARMDITGEQMHTVMVREPDGLISGVTDTLWAPFHRTIVYQQFTGVRPDARGRGLGKWIKAAMLLHVRELYPDLQWVSTDNAGSNAPMLKINRAMGFKAYRNGKYYQVTRDELAQTLKTL
jgi:mycothiol synthase